MGDLGSRHYRHKDTIVIRDRIVGSYPVENANRENINTRRIGLAECDRTD